MAEAIVVNTVAVADVVSTTLELTLSTEIAIARPPVKAEEPEEPVSITDILGLPPITEEQSRDSVSFLETLAELHKLQTNTSLHELNTAESKAAAQQDIIDADDTLLVYEQPSYMMIASAPTTEPQIRGAPMFTVSYKF